MTKTTEQIVREFAAGEAREDNARHLFRRYYRSVCGFFRRKGFSPEDCEEMTEDVFLSVFRNVGSLSNPAKFESWIFTIARNAYRNELERRMAHKRAARTVSISAADHEIGEPVRLRSESADPETQVLERERMERVRESIASLPRQRRRCLFLRLDGRSYGEIADILQISTNTVSAHIHQARQALKRRLGSLFSRAEF